MSFVPHARFALIAPVAAALGLYACAGERPEEAAPETAAVTHTEVEPVNDRPNPYETVENFFALPDGRAWGATSAVYIDPDGTSIWAAERCGANSCAGSTVTTVHKWDAEGNLQVSFGADTFIWPHGIFVDPEGNVWVTDARGATEAELEQFPGEAGKGHTVVKFSPTGEVLMTLGTPGVEGAPPDNLTTPNDVIVAPNGDIFVAEGHGGQSPNAPPDSVARISKFSSDGTFIRSWGSLGSEPGQFRTPHGLAFDSQGRLFVADRGNVRIQIFDQEGNFLDEWPQFSRLSGIYIDDNDVLYGADSESNSRSNPGWLRGIRIGSARDGSVSYFIPDPVEDPDTAGTSGAEGVAADVNGNVYGAEVGPRALKKYVRQ